MEGDNDALQGQIREMYELASSIGFLTATIVQMLREGDKCLSPKRPFGFAHFHEPLAESFIQLSGNLSGEALLRLQDANQYPAIVGTWCEASYVEVAARIGVVTLNRIAGAVRNPELCVESDEPDDETAETWIPYGTIEPPVADVRRRMIVFPEAQATWERRERVRSSVLEIGERLTPPTLQMHLWKEAIRATGDPRLSRALNLAEIDEDICKALQSGPAKNTNVVLSRLNDAGCVHADQTVKKALARLSAAGVLAPSHPNGKYGYKLVQN